MVTRGRMRLLTSVAIIVVLLLSGSVGSYAGTQSSTGKAPDTLYIVQMAQDPVIAYEGGIAGLAATKPAKGQKINPNSQNVVKYAGFLTARHDEALNAVGAGGKKVYDYVYSYNGFAASLSEAEVAALRARADVVSVTKNFRRYVQTDNTPTFLGLTDPDTGLYANGINGEGVIIGVLDTGIWPEHPSFSDRTGTSPNGKPGKLDYLQIPGWHGKCTPGEQFVASDCNQKLIGAQYYHAGFTLAELDAEGEILSARDANGHGTHTASTAGGNANVAASILGVDLGTISGIAPRARISAYKVCWGEAGCAIVDIVAAIDQATADGVDVINYSIGGGSTSLLTPDAISFFFAQDAGIFVATSAGNSGPGASTIGNPAVVPWITSVGASTHNRRFQGQVLLGNGTEYFGVSTTHGTDLTPDGEFPSLVDAADIGDNERCLADVWEEDDLAGMIVLCKGSTQRASKSRAVLNAGGVGMILYGDNSAFPLMSDTHHVPTVHVEYVDGLAIKAYIAAPGDATADIDAFSVVYDDAFGNVMAGFSSRGPNGGAPDIIKPDVTAPGVSILAAFSPLDTNAIGGELFQAIGGTSMSSPHVAGLGALMKQAHPTWTPAMIKSALMTTARQDVLEHTIAGVDPDGSPIFEDFASKPADPFDFGAGHVAPNSAVDPGLVYNAGALDYFAFLCTAAPQAFGDEDESAAFCAQIAGLGFSLDPSDLNLASIGIAELAGIQTIQRTVINVGSTPAEYTVSVDAPAGIDVDVEPSVLTLNPGQAQTYDVTFTRTDAVLGEWVFGSLTWSDGAGHNVRSPIAVKPVALSFPAEVFGTDVAGDLSFDVIFGYNGTYTAAPVGLVPATTEDETVVDDPTNDITTAIVNGIGIVTHTIPVLAGTTHFRVALFDESTDGEDDLDLYVWGPDDAPPLSFDDLVDFSGSPTSNEQVDIPNPTPGVYTVIVHGWQTDGPDADYTLFSWQVPSAAAGNLAVDNAPASATLGGTGTVEISWSGLTADLKYLGAITHTGPDGLIGYTLVNIDSGTPPPTSTSANRKDAAGAAPNGLSDDDLPNRIFLPFTSAQPAGE